MSPPLHLPSRILHPGDCTPVSYLTFELSVETKQASPMGLAFHFGYTHFFYKRLGSGLITESFLAKNK